MEEFQALDRDGNVLISAAELRQVFADRDEKMTYHEANEAIRLADLDGDDLINYEEFDMREVAVEFGIEEEAESEAFGAAYLKAGWANDHECDEGFDEALGTYDENAVNELEPPWC